MVTETLIYLIYAWVTAGIMQLIGGIWLFTLPYNPLKDKGWAAGRVATWLAIGLPIWFLAYLGLPVNTNLGVALAAAIILAATMHRAYRHRQRLFEQVSTLKAVIFTQEFLFALGLTFLTFTRGFNPDLRDLEKPMDAGFMASYLRSSTLPAADMWLSGETINYYSHGHYLGSILTRLWGLEIAVSYNLILALIMGLTLALSFSVALNLIGLSLKESPRTWKVILAGLAASFLVAVGGNSHTMWYRLANGNWQGYWYADATRFIENTIHEFPSYSFVVADIHAHVWNLPLVLSFLLIVITWMHNLTHPPKKKTIGAKKSLVYKLKKQAFHHRRLLSVASLLGLFIGIFVMTSTWDALIYSLFLMVLGVLIVAYDIRQFLPLLTSALIAIVTAALTALPWFYHFTSISEGIALVTEQSPLHDLAILWTGHVFISAAALALAIRQLIKTKTKGLPSAILILGMVAIAWILLALPEIIYFKDIYSGHPRANTMFKLTYQAFILMGVSGGWLIGRLFAGKRLHRLVKYTVLWIITLILVGFATFPYFAYKGYYSYRTFKGLDGYRWFQEKYPTDYAAADWLKNNIQGQPVILEAVGESYTEFARVSAYTGLPTVLGWRVHEWLWRGGFDIPGQRTEEVKTIYTDPSSAQASRLLDQYQVEYIFIGDKEYEAYPNLDVPRLSQLGETVYTKGRTLIIHRTRS